jgi:hypothetical protein
MQYVAILVLITLAVASAFMPIGNVARYAKSPRSYFSDLTKEDIYDIEDKNKI